MPSKIENSLPEPDEVDGIQTPLTKQSDWRRSLKTTKTTSNSCIFWRQAFSVKRRETLHGTDKTS